jgi:hypothetical protein
VGLLDGGGAALFAEVLSPLYLPATVYAMASTYNDRGDLQRGEAERPCRAQVDSATERMRSQPDFATTDRAIYILSTTLDGDLDGDAEVVVHAGPYAGTRWKVSQPIDRDPCGAYWRCRGVLGKPVPDEVP